MKPTTSICLEVLQILKSPPTDKNKWKGDPFDYLLEFVKDKLISLNCEDWLIKDDDSFPSTSMNSPTERTVDDDVRLHFSKQLGIIYEKLSISLSEDKAKGDEYLLLSLQQISTISSSLQFFILTAVLPFLEDGVGAGASARSTFIKSWKRYDGDVEAQMRNLNLANETFFNLLESNQALKGELLKKYADDIICINYQLLQLGRNLRKADFEDFLENCPKELLITVLNGLCRVRANRRPPQWLQTRIGTHLSTILMGKNGLRYFLIAYNDMGGENWYENVPLRKGFGAHLVNVPRSHSKKSLSYHSNIFKQFIDILSNEKHFEKSVTLLLIAFIEQLVKKHPKNAQPVIFDHFLRFYEILSEKASTDGEIENMSIDEEKIKSLRILASICRNESEFLLPERLFKISRIFADLTDTESEDPDVKKFAEMAKDVLKYVFRKLENLEEFLYSHVVSPMRRVRCVENLKKTALIQEIGEEEKSLFTICMDRLTDLEVEAARRLESVCEIVNSPEVVMKLLSKAVTKWLQCEKEDPTPMRFLEAPNTIENESILAHLIVGFCFEKLGEGSMETLDEGIIGTLLETAHTILSTSLDRLLTIAQNDDVIRRYTEEDEEQVKLMIETSRMCIGIASGAVLAAKILPEITNPLEKVVQVARKFRSAAESIQGSEGIKEKLEAAAMDAKMLCSLFGSEEETEGTWTAEKKTEKSKNDVIEDILESASDDEVAILGSAFIRAARVFQSANRKGAERLLERGFYQSVKDAIEHENSYVFLPAINCLCEIVCYDRSRLKEVIDIFANLKNEAETEEEKEKQLIRRGRMAEALGKVFCCLGEVSILYIEQIASIFLKCIREDDEIIKASACGAMASIVLASRGRGIEKYLDEMLLAVNQVLFTLESPLVRRAAVNFVRQTIRSCSTDILQILGGRLRDLRRKTMQLWRFDRDEVVRLHAQLCIEELDAAIKEILEEEESHYIRRIRI